MYCEYFRSGLISALFSYSGHMLTETTTSPRPSGSLWLAVRDFLRYKLPHSIGLDRAIAFTVLGRVVQGLGSVGSVLLIVHFLSAAEQGYYYALWSLVALQSVFELGFSFVILQVAAHERAHLEFHADGSITGSEAAHFRLASLLQRAVRWYTIAAVCDGDCAAGGRDALLLDCINSRRRRISGSFRCGLRCWHARSLFRLGRCFRFLRDAGRWRRWRECASFSRR